MQRRQNYGQEQQLYMQQQQQQQQQQQAPPGGQAHIIGNFTAQDFEEVSITELDDYIQYFYEEQVEQKVAATRKILLLTLDLKNIEVLLNHEQLMGMISRVLREDYKKSTELSTYMLCIFFIFSNYAQFHPILQQSQVGDSTMKILEHQLDRFDVCYSDFMKLQKNSPEYDRQLIKLNHMIAKQDKQFYIALTILLNMAEDFNIERKMKKRKIITYLIRLLERNDFHLLIVVLLFLRKLSIISENKQQMLEEKLIDKLGRFFSCNNNILLQLSLGVLKNLAFDKDCRTAMEQCGYIPRIVELLNQPNFRFLSIVLLYLMSLDDNIRVTFAYVDYMDLLIKLIAYFPEQHIGKELISLALNLSANKRNAELLTKEHLKLIVERAIKNQDILLFKLLRNAARFGETEEIHQTLTKYSKHFVKLALTEGKIDELKVELIGLLANIRMEEKWEEYLTNRTFIDFLHTNLANGVVEDDIILETIQLVSSICHTPQCAEKLAKERMLMVMCGLLMEKGDDDEFITQTLFAIYQFAHHKIGIEFILNQHEIMMNLLNNIQDKNPTVRRINDELLDILRDYDSELSERVKERKFYEYNKEWIESLEEYDKNEMGMEGYGYDYMGQPYYQGYADEQQLDPRMWDSDSEYGH